MIPGSAVGAIHRLAFVIDEDDARALVAEAVLRGASPDDAKVAFELWRDMRAATVQRMGGAVATEVVPPRCKCQHSGWRHVAGARRCTAPGCGCGNYRAKEAA